MFSAINVVSLTLAFSITTHAHMLLYKPQPYASGDIPDNGPLDGSEGGTTSNYPCKSVNGLDANGDDAFPSNATRTEFLMGSNYTVQFQGQSVHGGGSCQFSLTKDLAPNTQSEFKVIHTIEGGCPARNTPGNLGGDTSATAIDPFGYPIPIPDTVEPGNYTFAWTWFNKVGNREMYMGCAPIEMTGTGAKDSTAFDALPNLFLANIPDVECHSPEDESVEMKFPDPGSSLQIESTDGLQPPTGDVSKCYAPVGKVYNGGSGSARGSSAVPTQSSISPSAGPVSTSAASAAVPTASLPSSAVVPAASSTPVASQAPAPSQVPSSAAPVSASAPASPSSTASGSCASGSQPCSNNGGVVCIGSKQFGICNWGCAVAEDLAAGTSCSNGVISKRGYVPPQARKISIGQSA